MKQLGLSLGTKSTRSGLWKRSVMFGLAQDVNPSLLGKDRMRDPPLIPDLKPSWDFLALRTASG